MKKSKSKFDFNPEMLVLHAVRSYSNAFVNCVEHLKALTNASEELCIYAIEKAAENGYIKIPVGVRYPILTPKGLEKLQSSPR